MYMYRVSSANVHIRLSPVVDICSLVWRSRIASGYQGRFLADLVFRNRCQGEYVDQETHTAVIPAQWCVPSYYTCRGASTVCKPAGDRHSALSEIRAKLAPATPQSALDHFDGDWDGLEPVSAWGIRISATSWASFVLTPSTLSPLRHGSRSSPAGVP